jgi:hypothetical protein
MELHVMSSLPKESEGKVDIPVGNAICNSFLMIEAVCDLV